MGARNSDGSGRQRQLKYKEVLAPTRLIHALSLAYLVAALVPRHANWMESLLGLAMATIGRHSLRVFCVGLFFAWIISRNMEAHPAESGGAGRHSGSAGHCGAVDRGGLLRTQPPTRAGRQ